MKETNRKILGFFRNESKFKMDGRLEQTLEIIVVLVFRSNSGVGGVRQSEKFPGLTWVFFLNASLNDITGFI